MERIGRQIQQHGRAPGVCGESRLRPGHQVLLQRPRGQGIPHVSIRITPADIFASDTFLSTLLHRKGTVYLGPHH